MKLGLFQIVIVLLILIVLFGRGRISGLMSDFGKGIKSFRNGLGEDEPAPARIEGFEVQPAREPAADKTAG